MSYLDIYTSQDPVTGKITLDLIQLIDPYPYGIGSWMLEKKYHKDFHGPFSVIADPRLPTAHLLKTFFVQHQAYRKNLKILLQELVKKVTARVHKVGDLDKVLELLGEDFCNAWFDLEDFLGDAKPEPYREGYLTDIFRYWRTIAPTEEIQRFEDLWVYVAGRPHLQE